MGGGKPIPARKKKKSRARHAKISTVPGKSLIESIKGVSIGFPPGRTCAGTQKEVCSLIKAGRHYFQIGLGPRPINENTCEKQRLHASRHGTRFLTGRGLYKAIKSQGKVPLGPQF